MAKTKDRSNDRVQVLVSVDGEHLPKLGKIVERCKAAGLDVDQTLDQIGTITGSVAPGKIAALSKVAGVVSVERAGGYDIGPPDSDLQ